MIEGSSSGSGLGRFEVYDKVEFRKAVPEDARIEKLAGGFGFLEGPVWTNRDGGYLIFSDIPRHELKRWSRGAVTNFRAPSYNNGNTRDAQGRLLTAEHDGRRVSVTEADGSVRALAERYQGKRLNSPNDLVVKRSDGSIWFTDPPYGLREFGGTQELDKNHVFRLDPSSSELRSVVDDFVMPNGLCFSPDERLLYIADSGLPRHIRVFDVRDDGTLGSGKVFCALDVGVPDGIRCDVDGRVWSSAGDGIQVFGPSGALLGRIITPDAPGRRDPSKIGPEVPANLCFGGSDWQTVYITACTALYRMKAGVRGAGILWE